MYLCRAASQALAARLSRAPSAASRLKQRAPLRQMSSGSVPGSSGENMIYYLLAGVAAFGGLYYAYRTVSSSRSKYIEHVNILHERSEGRKSEHLSHKGDEEETAEITEAETATEETDTVTAAGPAAQDESSGVSSETGGESGLPAADVPATVEGAQQEAAANLEAAANSEAATVQETVGEGLDVAVSSAHEENLDSVKEGVASAAQEMSDAATRDRDADAEESGQTSEVSTEGMTAEDVAKES
ncbi:protein MGARP isoform X2 [Dromaius novaehollandiae]|uniref:protein MGARP isoform X2 n=1 Tax=Dromaius novaehollandiae TaxID=8790 RepID=UPI000E1F73B8|nr:protein MGARP isoform X2 [Dromaius novaehollandiae]